MEVVTEDHADEGEGIEAEDEQGLAETVEIKNHEPHDE